MNLAVDLLLLLIVFFCALYGYKKGFIISCYNFLGGLISFVLTSHFARPFGDYIANSFLKPFFEMYFDNAFQNFLTERAANDGNAEIFSTASAFFQKLGLDQDKLQHYFDKAGDDVQEFVDSAISAVTEPIAEYTGRLIAWIFFLIVFFFLCRFVFKFFNLLAKLPVLNFANRSLGLVFGICYGFVLVLIFSAFLAVSETFIQNSDIAFLSDFSIDKTFFVKLFSRFIS